MLIPNQEGLNPQAKLQEDNRSLLAQKQLLTKSCLGFLFVTPFADTRQQKSKGSWNRDDFPRLVYHLFESAMPQVESLPWWQRQDSGPILLFHWMVRCYAGVSLFLEAVGWQKFVLLALRFSWLWLFEILIWSWHAIVPVQYVSLSYVGNTPASWEKDVFV